MNLMREDEIRTKVLEFQAKEFGTAAPAATAAPARAPETERTKPNRRENEFMMNLMVLRNTLRTNAPACRERAGRAGPGIWEDIGQLLELVDRIQNAMLKTMPESRDEYYSAYARHGHYELHIDGPVKTARHLLITDRHLAAMADAAMRSECILCMREGSEIGREITEALVESGVEVVSVSHLHMFAASFHGQAG